MGDELNSNRFLGSLCYKHPEAGGLRTIGNEQCVYCRREREKARRQDPEFKDKERASNAARMRNYREEGRYADNLRGHIGPRQPKWADRKKIVEIYKQAKLLGRTVDHILPLRGKSVSGLHVHNNLQILPHSVNFSKGNQVMENSDDSQG